MTTLPQTSNIRMPRPVGNGAMAAPVAPAQAATSVGMSAGDIWRVLRANAWLIIGSVIVGGILGVLVNEYLKRNYSRYTATGWMQITEKRVVSPDGYESNVLETGVLAIEQRSQAQLLRTDTLYNAVLNRPGVRETSWFKQFLKPNANGTEMADIALAKQDLDDKLSVAPMMESKLIQIQFSYSDPKDCATIITELVDEHLQNQTAYRSERLMVRTRDLNLQKNTMTLKNNRLKEDIARLAEELNSKGIRTAEGGVGILGMKLQAMLEQQRIASFALGDASSELETFQKRIDSGMEPAGVEEEILRDPRIQSLSAQIDQMQGSMMNTSGLGDQNPRVRAMQQEIARMQQRLEDMTAERKIQVRDSMKERLSAKQQSAESILRNTNQKIDETKTELGQLDYKVFQFIQMKEEQKSTDEQLQRLDKQIANIESDVRNKELASIGWAQHPEVPEMTSFPKLLVTTGVAVGLGLMLSLGIAFLRELMDTSVRSPRDITRVGQMNFLGMIPHEDDDPQVSGVPLPLVISQAPTSMIAEQFRQVRTRLQQAASLETTRSILVTSPGPGDGKTTVACNLAAGLALNGRRILLVDANFRRPQLHKNFNIGNEMGFSSALAAMENFESAVHKTAVMNLDVLPTGPKPANPTELMESQLLIDFIEKALEEYDHVIFDSGPLLFVSETVALAPRVDGVVSVVRARANSRGLLQRMRDGLRQLKAEHLGIILNAVRSQGGGYYGRNIKTYYEYQNGHSR